MKAKRKGEFKYIYYFKVNTDNSCQSSNDLFQKED